MVRVLVMKLKQEDFLKMHFWIPYSEKLDGFSRTQRFTSADALFNTFSSCIIKFD